MPDDHERLDPKGTMDTVPPPTGASDAYSAQTRVGTLPEHVLEAMRQHETDASLASRTNRGMRSAQRPSLAAPLVPAFPELEPPTTPALPAPTLLVATETPPPLPRPASGVKARPMRMPALPSSQRPLPPASPLAPLALTPEAISPTTLAPPVQSPSRPTPQEGWLAPSPPLAVAEAHSVASQGSLMAASAQPFDDVPILRHPLAPLPLLVDQALAQSAVAPPGRIPRGLVRSVLVIAFFALLGGLLAAAITIAGH
jgi:hypothetical protein